jgi:hypothetical protein
VVWREAAPKDKIFFTEPYARSVHKACNMCKFCMSHKKYMVLAPEGTEEGDLVCVLLGGQTRVVFDT